MPDAQERKKRKKHKFTEITIFLSTVNKSIKFKTNQILQVLNVEFNSEYSQV